MKTQSIGAIDFNDPLVQKIRKLKSDTQLSVLLGDYKTARTSHKELAKIGVDNFGLVVKVPNTVQGNIPLFSKYGWRIMLYNFLEKFRHKTPEEKKFREMAELYKKGNLSI